jgi:hypothetical protein
MELTGVPWLHFRTEHRMTRRAVGYGDLRNRTYSQKGINHCRERRFSLPILLFRSKINLDA